MILISSGTTATTTSGDTAVALIANANGDMLNDIVIKAGTVAGFFSIDGGTTWGRMEANETVRLEDLPAAPYTVQVKRIPSGTDLAGAYAYAWRRRG